MSVFGDGIIERLHNNTVLADPDNPMGKIIGNGPGEWLDHYDEEYLGEEVFLESATGKWLDLHGKEFGVQRKPSESDDDYRERIVYEGLGHLTVLYLVDVFGLVLYCFVADFDVEDNTLTSDNPYACSQYMTVAPSEVQSILSRKFVLGSGLSYITIEEEE